MVLQDTWLFKGTIKENIRYANPDATDEEIIAAAQKAQAHEFIQQLPQGYDTMVGESGGSLSQASSSFSALLASCLPIHLFCFWTKQLQALIRAQNSWYRRRLIPS